MGRRQKRGRRGIWRNETRKRK